MRGDATLVVLGNALRAWNRGIKITLFDLKVFSHCRTFLSTVLVGEPLRGDLLRALFLIKPNNLTPAFYNLLKVLYPVKLAISKL